MLFESHSYLFLIGLLGLAALPSAAWLYAWRGLLPGAARLAAALPVLAFNCGPPLLLRRVDGNDWSKPNERQLSLSTCSLA